METSKKMAKVFILLVVVTLGTTLHTAQAQAPDLTIGQAYALQMDQWLDRLSKAESGNDPKLIFLDVNHKYSYSCLQFQRETWQIYSKKFGIKGNIMDCSKQKQLAVLMIQSDYKLWKSWYTSVKIKGVGYPPIL